MVRISFIVYTTIPLSKYRIRCSPLESRKPSNTPVRNVNLEEKIPTVKIEEQIVISKN